MPRYPSPRRLAGAVRRRLSRSPDRATSELLARQRELERRLDLLSGRLEEALGTSGRTGRVVARIERSLGDAAAVDAASGSSVDGGSAASISVVIPTYNRAASLAEVIACLRTADLLEFEVVVVNGPSTDATAELLATLEPELKVVRCDVRNIAASRNLGIAAAAGSIVAFIDDDTLPDPGWLEPLVAVLARGDAAGAAGVVHDRTGRLAFRHITGNLLGEADRIDDADPSDWYLSPYSQRFLYAPGGNSAYRRAALVEIGGFDEAFEYGGEEGDVAVRLRERGDAIRAATRSFVVHQELANDDRTDGRVMTSRARYLRSKTYFVAKHAPPTFSAELIAASHARTVERFRAERARAVREGHLGSEALAAFEAEAADAVRDGAEMWAQRGAQVRDATWFGDPAGFRPFPHRPAGPDKQHVCLIAPNPGSWAGSEREELERLALEGHVVRVVGPADGPGRVHVVRGVWRHEVALPVPGGAAGVVGALVGAVREIAANRPFTSFRVAADAGPGWSATFRDAGLA